VETLVQEAVTVSSAPQMFPSDNKEDWKVEGGYAPFTKDGEKGSRGALHREWLRQDGKYLVLTNTMDYEPTITAFLESFSFNKAGSCGSASYCRRQKRRRIDRLVNGVRPSSNLKQHMPSTMGFSDISKSNTLFRLTAPTSSL
jgi:hypothetical protein